jgi:4'-phosphopantetheinyl transferase EntD
MPPPPSPLPSLFGPAAITAEAPVHPSDDHLFPEERAYLHNAAPIRRAQFGTARVCARRALAELGVAPAALVPRADRSPVWPPGIVGSISHTRERCTVVVARDTYARSLGLDIEGVRPLEPGVDETVLTPRELRFLRAQPRSRHDEVLMLFFSAKEAYYKCQYPLTGTSLDFREVELEIELEAGRFHAHALNPGIPAFVGRLGGRFAFEHGMVMCGIELSTQP